MLRQYGRFLGGGQEMNTNALEIGKVRQIEIFVFPSNSPL